MSESDRIDYSSDSSEADENTDTRPSRMATDAMDNVSANLRKHSKSCCATKTIAVVMGIAVSGVAMTNSAFLKTDQRDSGNPAMTEQMGGPLEEQVSVELTVGMERRKMAGDTPKSDDSIVARHGSYLDRKEEKAAAAAAKRDADAKKAPKKAPKKAAKKDTKRGQGVGYGPEHQKMKELARTIQRI